jgi:hypothetical protein
VADGTAPATTLQSYDPFALGLGPHTLSLGSTATTLVQSLIGGTDLLALRLQGLQNTNTQIYSKEGAATYNEQAPVLVVSYTTAAVPEPAPSVLIVVGGLGLFAVSRLRTVCHGVVAHTRQCSRNR